MLNGFYLPVLGESTEYVRLAGYFSSTAFAVAARGIAGLLENDGRMKLIAGAVLRKKDVDAIRDGLENPSEVIERVALEDFGSMEDEFVRNHVRALGWLIAEGKLKSLKVVLKTDVHGSLEAIRSSLSELRNEEVKVEVISSGVGGITENDVELVNNSENCVLLGFNVRPTGVVKAAAKQKGVEIKTYSIIYQLIDDITGLLTGMMSAKFTEENTGQADVRDTFNIPGGMVAGCMVVDGKLVRGGHVRVIRDGVVLFEGDLDSLKRFKDDVKEVGNGYECGVVINGYEDVQIGDVIETFTKVEQKVAL